MKLEAIDPLNLSAICVATVRKVRKQICVFGRQRGILFPLSLFRLEIKSSKSKLVEFIYTVNRICQSIVNIQLLWNHVHVNLTLISGNSVLPLIRMYLWAEFAGKYSANYTKCFATVQNQTSSCWLAEVCEDILRLSFFLSLMEREPIHVKSALKEKM